MNEELTTVSGVDVVEQADQDYIETINQLKSNSVSKEHYMKLKNENKKLLDALVNGNAIEQPIQKPKANVDDLRKELFKQDGQLSNLEFVEKTLELRDALIDAGEPDPFLPVGSRISPTPEEIREAELAAQVYKECLDYAEGDSEVFTNELMRRTVDVMPSARGRRSR